MYLEHCVQYGFNLPFTTPNYQITTTSKKEWAIVVQGEQPAPEDRRHGRTILDLALARHWAAPDYLVLSETNSPTGAARDAAARALVTSAGLQRVEVAAVILYTGPMVCAPCPLDSSLPARDRSCTQEWFLFFYF